MILSPRRCEKHAKCKCYFITTICLRLSEHRSIFTLAKFSVGNIKNYKIMDGNIKAQTQLFVCLHVCSHIFNDQLRCTYVVNQFTHPVQQENKRGKHYKNVIWYLCFIVVVFIHSYVYRHHLKMSSLRLKKKKFRSINLTCWRSRQPLHL